ncbi:sulfotransferase [Paracoccus litorisediminis]|uniref:sulfotransferase n=1 Tax=Paracoccus litorisediminis TaxID=2006130 RepID=UPI00372E3FBA
MTLPQIIGFGAHKAGTTWLHDNLIENPGICAPPMKEMQFFNHRMTGQKWMIPGMKRKLQRLRDKFGAAGKHDRADHYTKLLKLEMLTEEWYRAAYSRCPGDQQSLDITPAYALLDAENLRYMNELLGPGFKAIYLIRDPADRIISAVRKHMCESGDKQFSVEHWLRQITEEPHRKRSDYEATIQLLDETLGDRVLYLPFKQVKADPVALLRRVEKHCGLPAGDYPNASRVSHMSPRAHIPQGVQEAAQILLRRQYAWLEQRFTPDFLSDI